MVSARVPTFNCSNCGRPVARVQAGVLIVDCHCRGRGHTLLIGLAELARLANPAPAAYAALREMRRAGATIMMADGHTVLTCDPLPRGVHLAGVSGCIVALLGEVGAAAQEAAA